MLHSLRNVPKELTCSNHLVLWKEIEDKKGKNRKTPVSTTEIPIGYNDPSAILPLETIESHLDESADIGFGVSLLDGLSLDINQQSGYLHCLDFDGFADCFSFRVDDGVLEFLRCFPSYCEISPSETGFKYFFISDRPPETKFKFKFSPSAFAAKYPAIRKYEHREIEVFSQNCFLALTGKLFNSHTTKLNFMESSKADEMYAHLNNWTVSTGGEGRETKSTPQEEENISETEVSYSKLIQSSLESVLTHIDHIDEQVWTDTSNALARAYGEDGLPYFLSYSAGHYCNEPYEKYDEDECKDRFDRALKDLHAWPDGYGVKHLIDLASAHPDWPAPTLEYDVVSPFSDETKAKNKFNFLTTTELAHQPPLTWRVKGLLPDKGIASIYGPSGSGKSFLALDLMAAVTLNKNFYSSKTKNCSVVYVALEGTGGIANRIKAYETYHKLKLPNSFRVVTDQLSLFNSDAEIFAEAIKEEELNKGVIVIDTLAQSAPGSDENSSADMGRIIANSQLLQKATDGLVVLIHHTGKDSRRGARGHSSFEAALDAAIEVKKTQTGREWRRAKVKDGEDGLTYPFSLEPIVLGIDEDGAEITSCVAVGDLFRVTQPKTPTGRNQRSVLTALKTTYSTEQWVPIDEVHALAEASLPGQLRNNKQRAKEAVNGLVELGQIEHGGDNYKMP